MKLPEKITDIDQLRINRNIDKKCKCKKRKFVLDTTNKRVICNGCGAEVDPYDALYEMATNSNRLQEQVEQILEQRKQIVDYKPWLVTIRKLEKQYRGKKMLPNCPVCEEPFYLEELTHWTGKPFADARIKRRVEQNER
ncbi:hypothetical protein WMZ97_13100 [Lentibacillus sp. N15]|uniref:hypothetical protein n=1 Tax=Lentibacillus songyuanensis TaxID=3136161 RepID=UPI0031B9F5AD